ncbi:uncharacterized protein [Drosophila virilis]|uniref:MD-2-related lipid-recognition domain-containing protein n=1 Tax=Drosophila virilis TaxID=7244 RepID=B4LNL4_DROVI|nr:uncharacterized protein LOC6625348 [Drosophila virilis]EDW62194.1 uncharacterized protein Dvir_GJ19881 [Drosophila virilis]
MYTGLLLSLSVAWILLLLLVDGSAGKRNWVYEPLSIDVRSTDASKVQVEAKVERIGRRDTACSGKLVVNCDMDETFMVEGTIYRSFSGNEDDYKLLPLGIPKQTFKSIVESYYKDIIYKNLEHCSNIPKPENAYPWPKGTFIFDRCTVTGDGLPEVLPEGYYKINFDISGPVETGLTAIVKLTSEHDIIG